MALTLENPNNNSAHLYDIASRALKPQSLTDEEITLITTRFDKGARILDVGGGTGRHAIPLAQLGYEVTVIDSASEMLKNLQSKADKLKLNKLKIVNQDFYRAKFKPKEFDFAILFWNSFNEIALNQKQAKKLLESLKRFLKKDSQILINIDDALKVDPSKFDFRTSYLNEGNEYKVHWETSEYFKKSNIAISKETVTVINNSGEILEETVSYIKQKYWRMKEIQEICSVLNLKVTRLSLKESGELYLLLSAKS